MEKRGFLFSYRMAITLCMISITFNIYGSTLLRSEYRTISRDCVIRLLKQRCFFDKYCNPSGDFKNQFESKTIDQDKVVIDHATALMWHVSGSQEFVSLEGAKTWVAQLNKQEYAGSSDWRLPTLEEALSLLENEKKAHLYIDAVFDSRQWCIWTGDTLSDNLVWVVVFSGRVDWFDANVSFNYVRPVCRIVRAD